MSVRAMGTPRNGLPATKPYVYRGTGADTLTPPGLAELLDEIERREMEREQAVLAARGAARNGHIPLQPCGTTAAYQRHMRRGEEPCEPCLEASRTAQQLCPDCGYRISSVNHRTLCGVTQ